MDAEACHKALFVQKEILANVNYWKKSLQINRALSVF